MLTGLITIGALLGVMGLLWYVWRHRAGTAARGIGAAGSRYNELYGQGRPLEMPSAASQTTAEGDFDRGA